MRIECCGKEWVLSKEVRGESSGLRSYVVEKVHHFLWGLSIKRTSAQTVGTWNRNRTHRILFGFFSQNIGLY